MAKTSKKQTGLAVLENDKPKLTITDLRRTLKHARIGKKVGRLQFFPRARGKDKAS